MAGEWKDTYLGNLIEIKHGYAFGGGYFRDEPPGDILLTPGNFAIGGGFKSDRFKYYDGPVPEEFVLSEGDLLVTMTDLSKNADTLGYPAIVPKSPSDARYLHNQRLGKIVVKDQSSVYSRYLCYLMRSREYRHEVVASATGTTVKHTSPKRIERFRFRLPPLNDQQAIACILGALDDKIELNRRMNRTLEGMARAIFTSWFVDFNPVRAKAAGQQPHGLKPDLAALFPDAFEDSKLGQIPTEWKVGTVKNLADVSSGKRPSIKYSEATENAQIPLWGGNGPMAFVPDALIDQPILLTGRVGTLGSVFRITTPCWPSDNTLILRTHEDYAFEYLYLQLLRIDFSSLNRGSTQPLLTQTDLKAQPLTLPPSRVLRRFHVITENLFLRMDTASMQSRNLAALREALLPKLISGELRVPDAERIVGRCI